MIKPGQQTGFVDEAAHSGLEGLGMTLGFHRDVQKAGSCCQARRHVLFQGNLALKRVIVSQIHDTKATNPDDAEDFEFAEANAGLQSVTVVLLHTGRDSSGGSMSRRYYGAVIVWEQGAHLVIFRIMCHEAHRF